MDLPDLESQTGIEKNSSETIREYIDRLGRHSNLSQSEIKQVKNAYSRLTYSPDNTLTEDEKELFVKLAESAEPPEPDETPTNKPTSVHSESPPSSETPDETASPRPTEPTIPDSTPSHTNRTSTRDGVPDVVARLVQRANRVNSVLFQNRTDAYCIAVLILGGAFIYYTGLGAYPFRAWDEGTYAGIASSIVQHGDIVTLHLNWLGLNYQPYFEKPPLGMWIEALSMAIFGVTEFGARLPSATAAILTAPVLYLFSRDIFGRRTGFLAGLAWLTTPYVYAGQNAGRLGGLETLTILFGGLFVYSTWKICTSETFTDWYLPTGLFATTLVLTKGFAAGIYIFFVLPLVGWRVRRFIRRDTLKLVAVTVLLTLPWFGVMLATNSSQFVQIIFYEQVLGRVGGEFGYAVEGGILPGMMYPYFRAVPGFFAPWSFFLLPGVIYVVYDGWRQSASSMAGALVPIWILLATLGFFATIGNHAWYIMPVYFGGAIVVGKLLADVTREQRLASVGFALGLLCLLLFSPRLPNIALSPLELFWMPGSVPTGWPYLTAVLLAAVGLVFAPKLSAFYAGRATNEDHYFATRVGVILLTGVLIIGVVGLAPPAMNTTEKFAEQKELGQAIQANTPAGTTIYFEEGVRGETGEVFTPVGVYSHRQHQLYPASELGNEGVRYAVVTAETKDSLEKPSTVLHSLDYGDTHLRFVVFESN